MTEDTFRLIVAATAVITIGSVAADEIGASSLPEVLRSYKHRAKALAVASSVKHPLLGFIRIATVVGYMASLVSLFFFVTLGPWLYAFFTAAWALISFRDAPHVISRTQSILYESSLLLNGCVLALCFFSPISVRFEWPPFG